MKSVRWFYILLISAVVAAGALGLQRLFGWPRTAFLEAVVAASVAVTIVALLGFLSRLRD